VASASAVLGGLASVFRFISAKATPPGYGGPGSVVANETFPRIRVANMKDLPVNKGFIFNYPLTNTPNILVKLGKKAETGVGPDGDIVAFSAICQHLGCYMHYDSSYRLHGGPDMLDVPVDHSPCHEGFYDLLRNAKVVGGPPPRPVPAVILEPESSTGDLYAVGMKPPTIFGHGPAGSDDITHDLEGGTIVTQDTLNFKPLE